MNQKNTHIIDWTFYGNNMKINMNTLQISNRFRIPSHYETFSVYFVKFIKLLD